MQIPGWSDAGSGVMMQVLRCSDAGAMQVYGWFDAGPQMVRCRSLDEKILETETLSG